LSNQDEYTAKDALAELQKELGPEVTAQFERHAKRLIDPVAAMGDGGRAILGYLAVRIAAAMEDW
jgi:hypothetical protein